MFGKFKELKGMFYRKMKEEEIKQGLELPGFSIEKPKRIIELPKVEDMTKLNVIYPLLEPFVYVNIKWEPEIKELVYQVIEPELTEEEKKLFNKISDALIELVEIGLGSIKETSKAIEYLEEQVAKIVKEFNLKLTPNQYIKIMYIIYRNFIGYNEVEAMMQDPNIEDISCDGINTPIFVVHRKYGSIRSNVVFTDIETLREFIIKLAERCGRYVSYAEPILDGTLPDGSLGYDEQIVFKENGILKVDKIGKVIDGYYQNIESDKPVKVNGLEVPTFNEDFKVVWMPVEYVYRHRWTGKLYKITTETGREITLTGNHSIFVLSRNLLNAEHADRLRVGDYLVIPLKIPESPSIKKINLVEKLSIAEFSDRLFLSDIPSHLFSKFEKVIHELLKNKYKHPNKLFKIIQNQKILPIKLYNLLSENELKGTKIFELYHPQIKISSILEIDSEIIRLLGYYIAEGWLSKAGHEYKIVLAFGKHEKDLIEDVKTCFKKCFGKSPYVEYVKGKNEVKISFTSRVAYFIFSDIFNVQKGAENKRVPEIIFNVDKNLREEFIRAWWKGGYTISKNLTSDILYLLLLNNKVNSVNFRTRVSNIEGRKINSEVWYLQRLAKPSIYPYQIPVHVINPLCETHMRLKHNKRISRERLEKILSDKRYERFGNLKNLPKKFVKEWRKRGLIQLLANKVELTEKGEDLLKEIDFAKALVSSDLGFVRIKDIKLVDSQKDFVYDVSVKGLENFVGGSGGLFCHNSRVSATIASDVATRGGTFTIRKFGEKPFSPIEQIDLGTVSPEILAYLWYLIESRANVLIVGGTATGKTSFLNSICMFIPPESKIVSIEDTREIRVPHEHWISGLARVGFGIPMPTGEKYGEVSMFDLLKESFRQNPDYVIVGETRGAEAYVMFQGMASGHASYSTFHAGSLDAVVKRLTTPPINLSPTLIESLNIVVIMTHAKEKGKAARRIKEIIEIVSVDPKTEEVKTNLVFMWDPVNDTYQKVNDSIMVRKFVEAKGGRYEDALAEIERRRKVIEWLHSQGIKDFIEVVHHINMYYKESEKLFGMMKLKEEIPARAVEIKTVEKPAKRTSILELLGFKFIREKPQ